jgi:hypothetical protein
MKRSKRGHASGKSSMLSLEDLAMSDEGFTIGGEVQVSAFIHKYTIQQGERLYAPLNDFLIILSALAQATSHLVGGTTHTSHYANMRINAPAVGHAFGVPLRGPLERALQNQPPAFFEIGTIPPADPAVPLQNAVFHTKGLERTVTHLISPIFIMFFERYNDWLDLNLGRDAHTTWPTTLNFARVIRNAAAHGKITIRNPSAPPVTWKNISIGPADNGCEIIGHDLRVGDVIGLMFEVDAELDRINVPIL